MKPSEILRDVIETNPDVKLAFETYHDAETGHYDAMGLIAKARGTRVFDFISIEETIPELFPDEINLISYINNFNDEGYETPIETLQGIIAILEEKGL